MTSDCYDKTGLIEACDRLAKKDRRIQQILERTGYPPFWHREPGFESLVMIILEQQVSLASAFSVYSKLKGRLGDITPEAVLGMTDDDFAYCGFSRQKKAYVSGLASEIAHNGLDLEQLADKPSETIRQRLIEIKGIGHWTADIYLLSCLHKQDVFPVGDLALIKAMRQAGFVRAGDKKESILRKVNRFKPYRSIFTIIMWHCYIRDNNITPPFDL